MADEVSNIIIGTAEPSGATLLLDYCAWINPSNSKLKVYHDGVCVMTADLSEAIEGVSEEIPLEKITTMVFKNGLLVKYG